MRVLFLKLDFLGWLTYRTRSTVNPSAVWGRTEIRERIEVWVVGIEVRDGGLPNFGVGEPKVGQDSMALV